MKLITRANLSCPDLDIHKSKEAIVVIQDSKFHGFGNQFKNGMLNHLLPIWKHNYGILTQDHVPQPLILNNKNKDIMFGNKHEQVFHELFLPKILLFIRNITAKVICDGPITNNKFMLGFFLTLIIFCNKIQIHTLPPCPCISMLKCHMLLH